MMKLHIFPGKRLLTGELRMIKYDESSIEAILPDNLRCKPEVQAISYAIQQQIKKLSEKKRKAMVYVNIDEMEGEALDLLALELGSQYYDETLGLQEKREIAKNTLKWHMKSGTVSAVEELIKAVFGEGRVIEWFDFPEGEQIPGLFDIETESTLSENVLAEISEKIEKVKNARSHLRYVRTIRHAKGKLKIGGLISSYVKVEIRTKGETNASII